MGTGEFNAGGNPAPSRAGADLGKILTYLLQNERRRRKLLGGSGACSPGKFSNFNYLKCPFLAF